MRNHSAATTRPPIAQAKPPSKNRLLIKFREWHIWLGIALSLFIIIVCVTGIYLNHEWMKLFGAKPQNKPNPLTAGALTTVSDLTSHPVSFAQALARAREVWGDVPIKHVHLNDERGTLIYKIKAQDEDREITINAVTGALTEKNSYRQNTQPRAGAEMKRGINWNKLMKDLHTGKLGGEAGKLLMDFTSVVIIGLTLTGAYLWIVPKWRRRRAKNAAAQALSSPHLGSEFRSRPQAAETIVPH
ncbi:MAG: PepSY domain-containing protein [Deltaproteobacteria bacterium]|nr:PepSY domain-containing protein [Deltaproteobacteria bacterium]